MSRRERVTYQRPFRGEQTVWLRDVIATADLLYGLEVTPTGDILWFGKDSTSKRRHVIEMAAVTARASF